MEDNSLQVDQHEYECQLLSNKNVTYPSVGELNLALCKKTESRLVFTEQTSNLVSESVVKTQTEDNSIVEVCTQCCCDTCVLFCLTM